MNKTPGLKPQATHKINSALEDFKCTIILLPKVEQQKKTFKRHKTPFNLNSTTYRYNAKFGFTEINLKCVCIKIFILKMLQ